MPLSTSNFWLNALSTFLGAGAGAGVGGFIAFRIFKNESDERAKARAIESAERATRRALGAQENYEMRFTEALARLLDEIALYAKSLQSRDITEASRGDFPLDTAICVAEIVAKKDDLKMIQVIRRAFLTRRQASPQILLTKLGFLSSGITEWRVGSRSFDYCYHQIERWTFDTDSDHE